MNTKVVNMDFFGKRLPTDVTSKGNTTGLTDKQIKVFCEKLRDIVYPKSGQPVIATTENTSGQTGIDLNAENILVFYGHRAKVGWKFQLTENQKKPVDDPSWQQIARALSTIDGTAPHSYAILASQNGEFIQACACKGEYHVEVKTIDQQQKTESLCVAGVAPSQTTAGKFGLSDLPIAGIKGEVLNKAQALKLFKPFWKNTPMPVKFLWRDIWPETQEKNLMAHLSQLRQETNAASARTMIAWTIAVGLSSEIESIRAKQIKVTPAPGLAKLRERVNRAAKSAAAAADPAWSLCEEALKNMRTVSTTDKPHAEAVRKLRETKDQLVEICAKALTFAEEAECAMRRLAQLGFGVSALLGRSARIERLDRTCVAVLHPPDGHGIQSSLLSRDNLELFSKSRKELLVEISGIVCRLLIDRDATVGFWVPGPEGGCFEFTVDTADVLVTCAKATSQPTKAIQQLNKPQVAGNTNSDLIPAQTWPSPVRVHAPAKLAVDTLFDVFDLARPEKLAVTIEPKPRATVCQNP